jgi:hypothetical protein
MSGLLVTRARYTVRLSPPSVAVLDEVVRRPGTTAAEIGDSYRAAALLRRLRETGLVDAHGPSPARWYPTSAGQEEINGRRLPILRERARAARKQTLAEIRRAEDLFTFADTLGQPATPALCQPAPGRRSLSFGALARRLKQSVGRDALISTTVDRVWPHVSPITAVGVIDQVEEERSKALDDWTVILSVGDTAFVEFSRRMFEGAEEDVLLQEFYVRQASQTTVIWFDTECR